MRKRSRRRAREGGPGPGSQSRGKAQDRASPEKARAGKARENDSGGAPGRGARQMDLCTDPVG